MSENMIKNWARIIAMILSLLAFMFFTPGSAKQWYRIGTGLSYDKELTMAGFTHQESTTSASHDARVERSKRNGVIYSALMVNGIHLPLLFYLLLTVIIITTPLSQAVNRKLVVLFPAFFYLWDNLFWFCSSNDRLIT